MTRSNQALLLLAFLFAGCMVPQSSDRDPAPGGDDDDSAEEEPPPFELWTTAFEEGGVIPLRYECGGIVQGPGENISPDLAWTDGPEGTASYAIVMDDVDSGVVHWVIYDIPADVLLLAEDLPSGYILSEPDGALQAELQGSGYHGYFGPCSEFSTNTYRWTLHAVEDEAVPGASQDTNEYDMVPLIEAASLESVSLSGES